MKIPQGKSETEIIELIEYILNRVAKKYVFGVYSVEDIKQEGFILALSALKSFDETKGSLEGFLHLHITNRLKSFKRDHSLRLDSRCNKCSKYDPLCGSCQKREATQKSKKSLLRPVDINGINPEGEKFLVEECNNEVEINELTSLINQHLSVDDRTDYLKMKDGIYVPKSRRLEIEAKIKEIIGE